MGDRQHPAHRCGREPILRSEQDSKDEALRRVMLSDRLTGDQRTRSSKLLIAEREQAERRGLNWPKRMRPMPMIHSRATISSRRLRSASQPSDRRIRRTRPSAKPPVRGPRTRASASRHNVAAADPPGRGPARHNPRGVATHPHPTVHTPDGDIGRSSPSTARHYGVPAAPTAAKCIYCPRWTPPLASSWPRSPSAQSPTKCAVRHSVVSLIQLGGTRKKFLGSMAYPESKGDGDQSMP